MQGLYLTRPPVGRVVDVVGTTAANANARARVPVGAGERQGSQEAFIVDVLGLRTEALGDLLETWLRERVELDSIATPPGDVRGPPAECRLVKNASQAVEDFHSPPLLH